MRMPPHTELEIGTHSVLLQDDIIVFRIRGVLTLEDAEKYLALVIKQTAHLGYTLTCADLSQASAIPPEVRRYFFNQARELRKGGARSYSARASFGMRSPLMRAVATMVNSIMQLVFGSDQISTLASDEQHARAWLVEQRVRFREK